MADHPGSTPNTPQPDDIDPGSPVEELSALQHRPARGFFDGIRRRIDRRTLAADTAEFSWSGLAFIVMQFVRMVFELIQPSDRSDRTEGDR